MASRHSLRRLATLTKKIDSDLHKGGMGMTFRYLFRTTAVLSRVVALLAEHVAEDAEQKERERRASTSGSESPRRARLRV